MANSDPRELLPDARRDDTLKQRDDDSIEGMGGGIAGPSEAGSAGTAGRGTAVGGDAVAVSRPSRGGRTNISDAVAEALRSGSGKPRKATDELADRDTGSPGRAEARRSRH